MQKNCYLIMLRKMNLCFYFLNQLIYWSQTNAFPLRSMVLWNSKTFSRALNVPKPPKLFASDTGGGVESRFQKASPCRQMLSFPGIVVKSFERVVRLTFDWRPNNLRKKQCALNCCSISLCLKLIN